MKTWTSLCHLLGVFVRLYKNFGRQLSLLERLNENLGVFGHIWGVFVRLNENFVRHLGHICASL